MVHLARRQDQTLSAVRGRRHPCLLQGQASDTDVVAFLKGKGLSPGEASVALVEVLAYTPEEAKRVVTQG